jgi:hypothetical protein
MMMTMMFASYGKNDGELISSNYGSYVDGERAGSTENVNHIKPGKMMLRVPGFFDAGCNLMVDS